jgi:stearoyl-CoA desaturase (delta-9 desaturase)
MESSPPFPPNAITDPTIADYFRLKDVPFWSVHLVALLGVAYSGWSWSGFGIACISYFIRVFFILGGYHRYFSHRTFRTSRWMQFVLAFGGGTAAQKSALWWAAHHRVHHKHTDTRADPHSPRHRGFWWSHIGWILSFENEDLLERQIPDFMKYPELRWLSRWDMVPPIMLGVALQWFGGWHWLLWGLFVSTVMSWHAIFSINSVMHIWGTQPFASKDDAKNNWLLGILVMGEGWHNNHHRYQGATRNGFYWWQLDLTYYVLRLLALFGLVWDLRAPPDSVLEEGRKGGKDRSLPAPADG